jgi:hypothetical protein
VELPVSNTATAEQIECEISDCLCLALDDVSATDNVPALAASKWCIPLAEEV